jgi:hypothetical protein
MHLRKQTMILFDSIFEAIGGSFKQTPSERLHKVSSRFFDHRFDEELHSKAAKTVKSVSDNCFVLRR